MIPARILQQRKDASEKSLFSSYQPAFYSNQVMSVLNIQLTEGLLLPSLLDIFASVFDKARGMGGVNVPPGLGTAEKEEFWELG